MGFKSRTGFLRVKIFAVSAGSISNAVLGLDFMLLFLMPASMTGDTIVRFQKGGAVWARSEQYMDSGAGVTWYLAAALAAGGILHFGQALLSGYLVEYLPVLPMVNVGERLANKTARTF
ncbi:MAG: hypothetical protein OK452_02530 [Thaumarchaeota archaeon]|nr:hypothetical protein [Nitrososphaerota archaeon]